MDVAPARPEIADLMLLPVPADAPEDTFDGGSLGTPAGRWVYRDAAGQMLGVILRFDPANGRKVIL